MISPVSKEVNLKRSIKKYFLDNLETTESLPLFFETLETQPLDSSGNDLLKWVVISFGRSNLGNVSEQQVVIDLYTKEDKEGDELASLIDIVRSYLLDEDSTSGLVTIPFYDTSGVWSQIGGMIPYIQPSLGRREGIDDTQFQSINILCKWGGK